MTDQNNRLSNEALPVIDFHSYRFGTAHDRALVSGQIAAACEQYGFFYLRNHGVAEELISSGFAAANDFFAQPIDKRLASRTKQRNQNRGYQPMLETQRAGHAADIKESFDMGYPFADDDPDVVGGLPFHGSNCWPDLPGFRIATEALYFSMLLAGRNVLEAMAEALGLDRNFFVGRCSHPSTNMRMVHYPQQAAGNDGIGATAHSDRGLITLLLNDSNGGLQVQWTDGSWIEAPPRPDALIVNVGDLMTRWTNDRFRSAMHRVINTSGRERFSIPQFHHPDFRTVVSPADISPHSQSHYDDVVAGEFVAAKFKGERKSWSEDPSAVNPS